MTIVDMGSGPPIVVIPGIQGRWEWMRPGIDALARRLRVVTYSLADEPTSGGSFDEATGFASYVEQVRTALDLSGLQAASICGVSYGGLIAAAFALKYPERVTSLALVSALPPSWEPHARARFFMKAPRLLSPFFCVYSLRQFREIAAASGGIVKGLAAAGPHVWNIVKTGLSPARMARRVRLLELLDLASDLGHVRVPTVVITGEEHLDRVVPVRATLEYAQLWRHARVVTLERTGHLGCITRPEAFADIVVPFVTSSEARGQTATGIEPGRRRIG